MDRTQVKRCELYSALNHFSACTTKVDTTMKGTCYTASECAGKGGTSGGNCAAGLSDNFTEKYCYLIYDPVLYNFSLKVGLIIGRIVQLMELWILAPWLVVTLIDPYAHWLTYHHHLEQVIGWSTFDIFA